MLSKHNNNILPVFASFDVTFGLDSVEDAVYEGETVVFVVFDTTEVSSAGIYI